MMSETIVRWAVDALIASSLLMAAVLLVRRHVRRLFGAQVAYALWALPLLRLLLPPIPHAWREAAATPVTRATETLTTIVSTNVADAAPMPMPAATSVVHASPVVMLPSLGTSIAVLWVIGAAAFLLWHTLNHRRFCRSILDDANDLGERDGVRVVATDAASGPVAFGVLSRYVAFPRDFADRWDADERALALDHELGHHARGDLAANWAALVVLALHWFNPLAWHAFRAFRADQELANDARVLAGRSRADRHIYACAIIKAAHGGAVSAACHLHTISDLKGRLKLLTTSRTSRRRLMTGVASVGVLVAAGLGATASGTQAAEAVSAKVGSAIGAPVAPEVPAPPMPSAPPVPTAAYAAAATSAVKRETRVVNGHRITTMTIDEHAMREALDRAKVATQRAAFVTANAPRVTSGRCGTATPSNAMTIRQSDGRSMMVCTDRIERAVQRANQFRGRGNGVVISADGAVSAPGVSVSSDGAIVTPNVTVSSSGAVSAPGVAVSSDGRVSTDRLVLSRSGRISSDGDPRAGLQDAIARLQSARGEIATSRYIPDDKRSNAMRGIDRQIESLRRRANTVD